MIHDTAASSRAGIQSMQTGATLPLHEGMETQGQQ